MSSPSLPVARAGSKRTLGVVAALSISALAILASASFHRAPPPPAGPTPGMTVGKDSITLMPGAHQWASIRLGVAKPAAAHWTYPVPARVRVSEERAARVGSPLAGRVVSVRVALGQTVKKGAVLFTVASPDMAGLRAEHDKAEVDLETAKNSLARIQSMVSAQVLPGKDALEADTRYREAKLALRSAGAKLGSLKVAPAHGDDEFAVVAPRDGIVVEKNVLPAQEVSSEGVLITVADLSDVWVVADLFEGDALTVKTGDEARITSPSLPGFSADTTVEMVSSVADPERHTVPLRVRLPNPNGDLKLNMFAEISFRIASVPGATEVLTSALVTDGNRQYVYVREASGRLARRSVLAGAARQGAVTIMKGLVPGEKVVEEGAILLDNQIDISN